MRQVAPLLFSKRKRVFLRYLLSLLLVAGCLHTSFGLLRAEEEDRKVFFTIRFGQGGFCDNRSPSGKFAGDQAALDVRLAGHPIGVSYLSEVLYGGEFDDESEERIDLWAVNIAYVTKPFGIERLNAFLGGGIGRLEIEREWAQTKAESGGCILYNLEGGVNVRAFWAIGLYVVGRYYYAQKKTDWMEAIDFNEVGFHFGLSINFGI